MTLCSAPDKHESIFLSLLIACVAAVAALLCAAKQLCRYPLFFLLLMVNKALY